MLNMVIFLMQLHAHSLLPDPVFATSAEAMYLKPTAL